MEPNDAEARKFHAIVLDNQGKPEEALKEINNCIALNPNQPDAYFLQGKALERLNMANDAITSFSRVISMDRSFEASYDELAKLYMQAGDASKAAAVLSAHLAMLNPASPKAKELAMEIERLKRSR
jgi:tetratricopeptide (TPR) repeat protein